jgi:hypothetical protein
MLVETLKDGGEWFEKWFQKKVDDWSNIKYYAIKNVKLENKQQYILLDPKFIYIHAGVNVLAAN